MKCYHFCSMFFWISLYVFGFSLLFCERAFSQEVQSKKHETKEHIEDLLRKGFANRDLIKTGQMVITSRLMEAGGNSRSHEISLAFDEERHRVDRRSVDMYRDTTQNMPYDEVSCIGCYSNGDTQLLLQYSNQFVGRREHADDLLSQAVMSIYDLEQIEHDEWNNRWTEELGFIPQYLAYFSTDRFPTKKTLEYAKGLFLSTTIDRIRPGTVDVTITEETHKGTLCKRITIESKYSGGAAAITNLWIAESQGYSLRKHHFQFTGRESRDYDELLEVDVTFDNDSEIWFPSAWHYERNDGGNFSISHTGTIRNVILNRPIPERVFDIKNIEIIPKGVMVFWHSTLVPPPHGAQPTGELLWDGTDIITRKMYSQNMLAQMIEKSKSERVARITKVLLINAIAIGIIVAIVSLRYYLRLKKLNSTDD